MTEVIKIEGGRKLNGRVRIDGSKNATVALIPAAILANEPVTIYGVPDISDVGALTRILQYLDVSVVRKENGDLIIDPTHMKNTPLIEDTVTTLRASYYFMGALLGKYGRAEIKMPGGCDLGPRPIDLHIKGFEALGATINYEQGNYVIEAEELIGAPIFLDIASVGATINILMAAVYAKGRTTIVNAAKEPEIIDVATILNKMGANIRGAGTNEITIEGVDYLGGCNHEIIPDRIEAGTYIILAAAAAGEVVVENIIPLHLESLLSKLHEMGVNMTVDIDKITIKESKNLKPVDVQTNTYPGFATDLQSPFATLLTQAEGTSHIVETIYKERFKAVSQLQRLGASASIQNGRAEITGPANLFGGSVKATDLRCGAALVIAGLLAEGVTEIRDIYHIDRGYANIDEKLTNLGAKIWREKV
ncbi:MAG TPA: UDP-N-acetylglucosamine 1-carboxyvinyltransferase [Erysipelotrichaceae bacterium]|nr:UDP-N-acetylglucosamine 1-carboxyvinyltransferase [Erysipelotrichaceae bacterium]